MQRHEQQIRVDIIEIEAKYFPRDSLMPNLAELEATITHSNSHGFGDGRANCGQSAQLSESPSALGQMFGIQILAQVWAQRLLQKAIKRPLLQGVHDMSNAQLGISSLRIMYGTPGLPSKKSKSIRFQNQRQPTTVLIWSNDCRLGRSMMYYKNLFLDSYGPYIPDGIVNQYPNLEAVCSRFLSSSTSNDKKLAFVAESDEIVDTLLAYSVEDKQGLRGCERRQIATVRRQQACSYPHAVDLLPTSGY
ncbi:expressed unknown protein [Seminavis robusta]|uniref:Uncharacterized protein n=1 Tax=Seminavis robusta TaxID=568900 RepID=A0A9N8ETY7_9STRA|nr:expressed unknown protein [Seminavis robusta]|eukprot:Sro1619_g286470.1 n/a (248) ;mRNA; r:11697-12939